MKSINRKEITSALAYKIVGNCVDLATDRTLDICAAVTDPRGHLVALARTDNVVAPAIEYAIDKSWTAATLATSTESFYRRASDNPALRLGLTNRNRVLVFPGGLPLFDAGVCIAGLGVSGAADEDDVDIARAVITQMGLTYLAGD